MDAALRDPYLWSALAAAFLGLAIGQGLRWLLPDRRRSTRAGDRARRGRRARRSVRALALASLAVLAAAALLVFPEKAGLIEPALAPWAAALAALGALAGFWPRAAGLPLAALLAAPLVLLDRSLDGWIAFRGPGRAATLLPLEVSGPRAPGAAASGGPSFRGELELAERDSVPLVQKVEMEAAEAGLAVESLEFRGPAGLAARLLRQRPRFYRFAGLVAPNVSPLRFPAPPSLLDRLAPLDPEEGLAAGAPPVERSALLGLVVRRRGASASVALVGLEPAQFTLGENMEALAEPL